jgi:hypothetical protein
LGSCCFHFTTGGQTLDEVGAEASPALFPGDNDGRLEQALGLEQLQLIGILREVLDLVVDTVLIELAVGRCALDAAGL